uniref:Uncharacterized protein n=1 Tax=Podoviridae sp. ctZDN4 TaxID=2825258 RepID=A0A8S5U4D3_9CAUD|nr:MAG TPA: hypothetical protein [Podoviridae sp. ctZDN4]
MTLLEYHKHTLGTSDHLTKCRVLWGGAELFNDYFSRLPKHAQDIVIRAACYDEKHDILTAYTTWNGYNDYFHEEKRVQYREGRYTKYGTKNKGI